MHSEAKRYLFSPEAQWPIPPREELCHELGNLPASLGTAILWIFPIRPRPAASPGPSCEVDRWHHVFDLQPLQLLQSPAPEQAAYLARRHAAGPPSEPDSRHLYVEFLRQCRVVAFSRANYPGQGREVHTSSCCQSRHRAISMSFFFFKL